MAINEDRPVMELPERIKENPKYLMTIRDFHSLFEFLDSLESEPGANRETNLIAAAVSIITQEIWRQARSLWTPIERVEKMIEEQNSTNRRQAAAIEHKLLAELLPAAGVPRELVEELETILAKIKPFTE